MDETIQKILSNSATYEKTLPLSYSKIKTLLKCPRQYLKRYIEFTKGAEAPQKEVMVVGSFVHKVLEHCLNKGQSFGWEEDAIDFDLTWVQVQKQFKLTYDEYCMAQAIRINTENVFIKLLQAINGYKLHVLPELQICVDKAGGVRPAVPFKKRLFYGYVDFYAETPKKTKAMLIDYKSHGKTESNAEEAKSQLETYVYYLFLRNKKLNMIQYGGAYLPDEDIDLNSKLERDSDEFKCVEHRIKDMYSEFIAKLTAGNFDPVPGKYCEWCSYADTCPEYTKPG